VNVPSDLTAVRPDREVLALEECSYRTAGTTNELFGDIPTTDTDPFHIKPNMAELTECIENSTRRHSKSKHCHRQFVIIIIIIIIIIVLVAQQFQYCNKT